MTRRQRLFAVVAIAALFALVAAMDGYRDRHRQAAEQRVRAEIEAMTDEHIMHRARALLLTIAQEVGQ